MSESEKCPECNNKNIRDDNANGERVCMTCGLVLGSAEFAPPADRIPKTDPANPIVFTSTSVGTEIESAHRIELNTAHDINRVIQKLELPRHLEPLAINYVRKLRHQMKQQNNHKIRLTRTELTTWSIWTAIKRTNYPLSADQYIKKLQPLLKVKNLMKIEQRAGQFIKNENRIPDASLVVGHINQIATKLENNHLINNTYANKISSYAIQIVQANPGSITNRKANLVAASALLAADNLLANQLRLKSLAQAASTGTGRLSKLSETYRYYAPALPKEWAAIKFSIYLFERSVYATT
ncbi:MAG: TFIIB-type zinc ribbon-containing protein [Nitrososphaerota archaeon]|jgi:transcription initiation factor TFIIIB Brf1 subunit/transcription initiation factor TFIIB|nr:TFIIB-type zinc ribbon-containing protein [Nitrososphaerota archaeon]